ncbi:MAG: hypothetical protein NWS57_01950, partial [Burkholderiaceae bacterium]|nr:hypothetical protein [Burkholderiaceae bacterium]
DLGHPTVPDSNPSFPVQRPTAFPVLASSQVHYVGQPIVLVVAQTLRQAQEAAALVFIDYEALEEQADTPTFYAGFSTD